jgi:alpha-tubulin suppressor-like RCC1 family protein
MKRLGLAALCAVIALLACAIGASASTGGLGWGNNEFGQLGNGSKQGGLTVYSVGENTLGQLNGTLQVSTGGDHTLALLANHTVTAWGSNEYGQLGNGHFGSTHTLPTVVTGLSEVEAVAAGKSYSLALLKNGKVMAWGLNNRGQLGVNAKAGPELCTTSETEGWTEEQRGEFGCSTKPVTISGLSEVAAISAGSEHALALLKSGKVMSWGENQFGRLGNSSSTGPEKCGWVFPVPCSRAPVSVTGLEGVSAVSAGGTFSLALVGGGTVKGWGENNSGQLGTGSFEGPEGCKGIFEFEGEIPCATKPVEVTGLEEVTAISAGGSHGLALLSSSKVKAWGSNAQGQVGDGTTTNRNAPVAVLEAIGPSKELSEVQAISAGGRHNVALMKDASLRVWGDVSDGQLGPSILNPKIASKAATGEVTEISAGESQTLVFGAPGPYIESISPTSGPSTSKNVVTIHGKGFTGATKVSVGGSEAESFEVLSDTEVIATLPSGSPGGKDLGVTAPRATTARTGVDVFRYEPVGTIDLGTCTKVGVGKGKFKAGNCTEEIAGGAWEWTKGVTKGGFAGAIAAETSVTFETTGGSTLTCTGSSSSGTWVAPKSVQNAVLKFTGCLMLSGKCSSAGAAEGEILSTPLEGVLGFFEKTTNKVGLDLFPALANESSTVFEATCGTSTVKVTGAVIGQITTINKMNSSFNLKFKQHLGKQTVGNFEEEPENSQILRMSINGGFSLQTGLSLESNLANEESLEINTVT